MISSLIFASTLTHSPPPFSIITDSSALRTLCESLSTATFIAVDTEFLRDKYYYPKLCLIQLGTKEGQFLIDPLAPAIDLSPLWTLFTNPRVLKVFHSAKQDIETVYHMTGQIIAPLYDTQIAAMAIGYFSQTSYASLVLDLLHTTLDKSAQFSQWDIRPLSSKQLTYAIDDVRYLYQLYPLLHERILKKKRTDWLTDDLAILTNPQTYIIDPHLVWQRLSSSDRSPVFLGILKTLASWREHEARAANRPRTHILKDTVVMELASKRPSTPSQLARIRGLQHLTAEQQTAILSAITDGKQHPLSSDITSTPFPTTDEKYLIDLLKIALHVTAKKHQVAERLIASSQDIADIILRPSLPHAIMSGWRYDIFGKEVEKILAGSLSLQINQGDIHLTSTSPTSSV